MPPTTYLKERISMEIASLPPCHSNVTKAGSYIVGKRKKKMEQPFSMPNHQATRSSREPREVSALPGDATAAPGESILAQVLLSLSCFLVFRDTPFDASKLSGQS